MTDLALSKDVILVAGLPPIIAVRLPDGELSATLRSLCDLLDLDRRGQFRRIHRIPSLTEALQEATISTPGGPQQAEVLLNWAISIWAAGLHVSRLSEAKRAAALVLQQRAFSAIEQAFAQRENNSAVPPPPSPSAAAQSVWEEGRAFIDHLEARDEELRNQMVMIRYGLHSHELRLAALEAGNARQAAGLSDQQLGYIYRCAHQVSQRQGYEIDTTLAGLAAHFRVKNIYYLPESAWPAVLDWFASPLEE